MRGRCRLLKVLQSKGFEQMGGVKTIRVDIRVIAAALLGINPSTLRNRMKKLGIPYGRSPRRGDSP